MLPKEITSLQHPIVKHLVKLKSDKEHRKLSGTALVMGKKIVHELASKVNLKTLLIEKNYRLDPNIKAEEMYLVTTEILAKITGLPSPEPVVAEVPLPAPADLSRKKFILGLDSIGDPGNLGTLLRTALALGWEGAFIVEGSVDPFNDKALRAAKGATFELPLSFGSLEDLKQLALRNKLHVYLADMDGVPVEQIRLKTPLLLLLGSESHGIRSTLKEHYESISIPINPKMESLNVGVAGAILMYNLKKSS
ncbi:MAG TPA: RNA methyltransferase [Rhabdochlamydiaceae bacterium]|nr:RNA methyltransferase [Rhabdochlamydiaceae bacterium]